MPYYGYYGGYGDFLANNIYCILLIPILILSVWAQAQVSGNFKRYSGVANRRRLTGAQAAEAPSFPPPRSVPNFPLSCCWWAWFSTASPCF